MEKIIPEKRALKEVANLMCLAARTAPKARGIDNIVTMIISGQEKHKIVERMKQIAKGKNRPAFARDSSSLKDIDWLVLIGTKTGPIELAYCGFCGFKDCQHLKEAGGVCAFNSMDLGIAVSSAASVANLHHADNRVMYTAGLAAIEAGIFPDEVRMAIGIPLSATGKNPFFDRP